MVLQVSTTGLRLLLVPPGQEIPVALLRLPDVKPTSGIGLREMRDWYLQKMPIPLVFIT